MGNKSFAMGTGMHEVARLLRLAARCRYLACVTQSVERRAELLEMAQTWEQLAEQRRLEVITTPTLPAARHKPQRKQAALRRDGARHTEHARVPHGL